MNLENIRNIPEELKKLDRWVCWRWENKTKKDGSPDKPAKVPMNPNSDRQGRAMTSNPATWGTFQDAIDAVSRYGYAGIGFVFNGDGVVGVDIDHCREQSGELTEEAKDIISTLNSYTEYSQSGNGVHIIIYGKMPEGSMNRKGPFEVYETGRYFVMTGNTLDDAHTDVENRNAELQDVCKKYLASKKQSQSAKSSKPLDIDLSDDEIIQKASNAANGELFKALMNGTWEGRYHSQSEADIALCNLLAFWFRKDEMLMNKWFKMSGLYRDKWDKRHGELTYGQITIHRAVNDVQKVYEPGRKKQNVPSAEPPGIDLGYDQIYGPVVSVQPTNPNDQAHTDNYTPDEIGRSKKFADIHKVDLRWCQETKSWLIWNGQLWVFDKTLEVHNMAKKMLNDMMIETLSAIQRAETQEQRERSERKYREVQKARSEKSIRAILELAKSELPLTTRMMDSDPFLLNCKNGVVDLRTGELFSHEARRYMTKIAAADYTPQNKFKKFGAFLQDITCGDTELADYFQQVCGMAAVGKVFYEGVCIFYGGGNNGKSTFLNTISKVLGDYSGCMDPEVLMIRKESQPVGLADVQGKRFITAIETEEGKRVSSARLKQLASTDSITARRLYENNITFEPTHTLILATNHLPKVSSTDKGTWRRIAIVPFKACIAPKKEIKNYANVLYEIDREAILTWIIDGAVKYLKNDCKISHPRVVQEATTEYKTAEDWFGNFLQECCDQGNFEESGSRLYDAYSNWCDKNNEYKRRPRDFASELLAAGFDKRHSKKGTVWNGVKVSASSVPYGTVYSNVQDSILDDDGLDALTRMRM